MEIFFATLHQMIVLIIFILIGYCGNKWHFLSNNTDITLARLENNLLMPAVVLNTFMTQCTVDVLSEKWRIFESGFIILTITMILAFGLSSLIEKDPVKRKIYRYSFAFPNIGFMGIAVIQGFSNESLLFDYMIFTLPYNILIYSIGITWLLPKRNNANLIQQLINPMFIALLVGAGRGLLEIPLNSEFTTIVSGLSNCMSPIAMMLTGYVIAKYDLKKLLKIGKVYFSVALRLIVIPFCTLLIFKQCGVPNAVALPAICALAMPMGLNTVVIPAAHNMDVTLGASMAFISSLFSVVTIPLIFMLVN